MTFFVLCSITIRVLTDAIRMSADRIRLSVDSLIVSANRYYNEGISPISSVT